MVVVVTRRRRRRQRSVGTRRRRNHDNRTRRRGRNHDNRTRRRGRSHDDRRRRSHNDRRRRSHNDRSRSHNDRSRSCDDRRRRSHNDRSRSHDRSAVCQNGKPDDGICYDAYNVGRFGKPVTPGVMVMMMRPRGYSAGCQHAHSRHGKNFDPVVHALCPFYVRFSLFLCYTILQKNVMSSKLFENRTIFFVFSLFLQVLCYFNARKREFILPFGQKSVFFPKKCRPGTLFPQNGPAAWACGRFPGRGRRMRKTRKKRRTGCRLAPARPISGRKTVYSAAFPAFFAASTRFFSISMRGW